MWGEQAILIGAFNSFRKIWKLIGIIILNKMDENKNHIWKYQPIGYIPTWR